MCCSGVRVRSTIPFSSALRKFWMAASEALGMIASCFNSGDLWTQMICDPFDTTFSDEPIDNITNKSLGLT